MPIKNVTVPTRLYSLETELAGPIVEPQPPPPATRLPFFTFNTGDIAAGTWQDLRDSMPTDATTGRPKPDTNSYYTAAAVRDTYINAVINKEVATLSSGRFYHNVHSASHEEHNDLRARVPAHFQSAWYLKTGVLYRFDMTFELIDSVGWSTAIQWGIPFQIWGQYSSAWLAGQHPTNPAFSLILDAANYGGTLNMEVQLYGTEDPAAVAYEYDNKTNTPISVASHDVTVWWKKDHTGANSYCRVDLDGVMVVERTNVKLGFPFDANGNVPLANTEIVGGLPSFGMYTPRTFSAPGVECYFSKYEISRPAATP